MNNNTNTKQININVSYNGTSHAFSINHTMTAADLKQMIFTHFQVDTLTYSLIYKHYKFSLDDTRPIYTILSQEKYPIIFLMKKTSAKKLQSKFQPKTNITIKSRMQESKFFKILSEFFQSKNLPFNAQIKNQTKGSFEVIFQNEIIAQDFQIFFNNKSNENKTLHTLPMIHSSSSSEIMRSNSNRIKHLQIMENKIIRNASCKYMNYEEKRIHEAYLDKRNWIKKEGFFVSVGKYSMKKKDIPNYVTMTPSEPPVNYKYRNVNKKKWITPKGFC